VPNDAHHLRPKVVLQIQVSVRLDMGLGVDESRLILRYIAQVRT
jgi:hypothetical protein